MCANGKHSLETLSARKMLHVYGLRSSSKALFNPLHTESGELPGVDEELALVRYVEQTEGFDYARPILRWVFADGKPWDTYPYRGPGETLMMAAMRHGQVPMMVDIANINKTPTATRLAALLLMGFVDTLAKRLKTDPFVVPDRSDPAREAEVHQVIAAWERAQLDKQANGSNCAQKRNVS